MDDTKELISYSSCILGDDGVVGWSSDWLCDGQEYLLNTMDLFVFIIGEEVG